MGDVDYSGNDSSDDYLQNQYGDLNGALGEAPQYVYEDVGPSDDSLDYFDGNTDYYDRTNHFKHATMPKIPARWKCAHSTKTTSVEPEPWSIDTIRVVLSVSPVIKKENEISLVRISLIISVFHLGFLADSFPLRNVLSAQNSDKTA